VNGNAQILVAFVKNAFANWLSNEVESFAGLDPRTYATANANWAQRSGTALGYCWLTLNAVLKTEASVQMRFGMWLDARLRAEEKELSEPLVVLAEAPLRFNSSDVPKRAKVDLAIYAKTAPLWESQCGKGMVGYGTEAEERLRGIIEVKLLSWVDPGSKFKNGGIAKDLAVLAAARRKWAKLPLFHLVLDESFVNPFFQGLKSPLLNQLNNLKNAHTNQNVIALSNNWLL